MTARLHRDSRYCGAASFESCARVCTENGAFFNARTFGCGVCCIVVFRVREHVETRKSIWGSWTELPT